MSERRRLLNQFERAGRDMAELPEWVRMPDIAKPEPSVPLSAIRALVQQWREEANEIRGKETTTMCELIASAIEERADQLAALCPAPPEET